MINKSFVLLHNSMNKKVLLNLLLVIVVVIAIVLLTRGSALSNTTSGHEDSVYHDAIAMWGEWFLNMQDDNFLYYEYDFTKDEFWDNHHTMREMGWMWSIMLLYQYLDDERYYDLANRGFSYFEESFVEDEENNFIYINQTPHKIKLGYQAFAILTLLGLDHPQKEEFLEKLANGILYQQEDNGRLKTFFYNTRATGVDYYPGEALVSLMHLYHYTKDDRYLDAVAKAFPYYRKYRARNPNTAFPPWQMRAYYEYFTVTKDPEVKEFVYEMADYFIELYKKESECSGFTFDMGIVTAVQIEGLEKAYRLAKMEWDSDRASCYRQFVQEAADYVLTLQLTNDTDFAERAMWGFRGNFTSHKMRTDRTQHSVMSLIEALESWAIK